MKKKVSLKKESSSSVFDLGTFIREHRKKLKISQEDLALRSGVGLRLIRDIEQGRDRKFRIDTINQLLEIFGYQLTPTRIEVDRG